MSETSAPVRRDISEKTLHPVNGILVLVGAFAAVALGVLLFVLGILRVESRPGAPGVVMIVASVVLVIAAMFLFAGIKAVRPNEAIVLTLFGKYYGTVRESGCFFVNPFCAVAGHGRVSLKLTTLKNEKQKVNDAQGNPILIGANVVWRIVDPTKAVFNVDNYQEFISIQTDSTIRNIARLYPYDIVDDNEDDEVVEKTLRSSSQEIACNMRDELQKRVTEAGIVIEEVKITDLAYSEEIAAAMLQRQQATAIIAARAKIVDGAVGMVKMALDKLSEDEIVVLDDERKAAMVSNLLVVLCSGKDTQPVVNSGSIY